MATVNTDLLGQLQQLLPDIKFVDAGKFHWSPRFKTVNYDATELNQPAGQWALIHEAGHGQLQHTTYKTDFELLQMEVAAWEAAKAIARQLDMQIDQDHIEDCLDTYRDWLHRRSTCPTCGSVSLQRESGEYHCHNCNSEWKVSQARFCRPYRRLS